MKKYILTALVAITLLSGCNQPQADSHAAEHTVTGHTDAATKLSPEEFKAKQATGEGVVIDVRKPEEYAEGHLKGAANLDYAGGVFEQELAKLDKSKTYYLYCKSGNRSGKSAKLMKEAGFEHVYNVGGIEALKEAGIE